MNSVKQQELEALAALAYRTKERFLILGSLNTFGLSREEREQRAIEYKLAEVEMCEAQRALDRAINAPQGQL